MELVNSNDLKYKYEAYGLKIHSEIYLPELMPFESESADVIIYLADVKLSKNNILNEGLTFKVTKKSIYRFWDEIGKFKITNTSITIDPANGINKLILRSFILGTIFATLLRLRGSFVLHASSINLNGCAICFSGFKGFGKSTTAMAFYNSGYPLVADDYVKIEFDNNDIPFIFPGFPNLRLSSESRKAMGLNYSEINLKKNLIDKTYASVYKSFSSDELPLKKIYILKKGLNFKIIDLKTNEAFIELVKNTFGITMFSKLELPNNFFQCERIVKNTNISILEIPHTLKKIQEVVKIVEDDIGEII